MGRSRDKVRRPFLQKLRFKYRVSVLDENTLEEAWHMRISRLHIFLYVCGFIVITFFILATLIYVTPIRYYLPGYGDEGNRETVIAESMRADSLQKHMNLQAEYLTVVKSIIRGDIQAEEIQPLDTFMIEKNNDISLEKTNSEREFVEHFEEEEKYNLSTLDIRTNGNTAYVFFRPVRGIIEKPYNASERTYGVSIITSPSENVLSVLDGTVIYADFSFYNGWVIQVQHEGNYISVYKNNTRLLKKVGDFVYAGESIAITGDAENKDDHFYFELWNNGNTINPADIIIF
ncbi:M23 family metallopeptidase [Paludibacteraceae bacterium OttesenSCG-928-F17]|nr:M23 family metallopeptidase [Paludibacteraceae bacterium OttesenSCG-928-F17]